MKELARHIAILLRHKECVVLPSVGAFLVTDSPAYFDENSGILYPPMRTVSFNQALSDANDGLLATSVARHSGIAYADAAKHVSRLMTEVNTLLQQDGSVTLENIGTLSAAGDGRISFHPRRDASATAALLGCAPLNMCAAPSEGAMAIKPRSEKYYHLAINKTFAQAAAAIILVLATAISLVAPNYDYLCRQAYASVVPVVSTQAATSIDVEDKAPAKPEPKASVVEEPVAEPVAQVETQPAYHLIVATFTTEAEALRYISAHQGASEWDLHLAPATKLYRVSAASSSNHAELQRILNSPEFFSVFPESWIWHSEH